MPTLEPIKPNVNQTLVSHLLTRRSALQIAAVGVATGAATAPLNRMAGAQSTPEDDGSSLSIPVYPYGQTLSLDPHRATNWGPHWVMLPNVWAGLLRFDANGAVVPDLASSVEPEGDGAVWVATLRPDTRYANGNPVTAQSLISAWKRALRSTNASSMVDYMRRVEGADAYSAGDDDNVGFEARDDVTVAITLNEPYTLFPEDLATFVWAAMDTDALTDVSADQVPFAGASAGLWQWVESEDDTEITMRINPESSSTPPSTFTSVTWTLVDGPDADDAALAAYQDGQVAVADITPRQQSDVEANDTLASAVQTIDLSGSTMLIGMDFRQAPFDDPDVRRAVAASIDREAWSTDIMAGAFTAARAVTPPVLELTANYTAPELIGFDPEQAISAVASAGIDEENMPAITYFQPAGSSPAEIEQAAALLAMIRDNSGLLIEHNTSLSQEQISARRQDDGGLQFDIRWWWPSTNSPSGLADLGLPGSDSIDGRINWSDESADAGVAQAASDFVDAISGAEATLDADERNQLYAQAESLLVENVVFVPLGHGVQSYVQSPTLRGTRQGTFTGYAPVAFDDQVELVES